MKIKLNKFLVASIMTLSITACSTPIKTDEQAKPGFSNITDIPLPETANIDLSSSMVMGGGNDWTGHLVYETSKSRAQIIDFTIERMQATGWTKVSELRGKYTLMTFMQAERVATMRVTEDSGFLSNTTIVSIDMTHSNLKNAIVNVPAKQS